MKHNLPKYCISDFGDRSRDLAFSSVKHIYEPAALSHIRKDAEYGIIEVDGLDISDTLEVNKIVNTLDLMLRALGYIPFDTPYFVGIFVTSDYYEEINNFITKTNKYPTTIVSYTGMPSYLMSTLPQQYPNIIHRTTIQTKDRYITDANSCSMWFPTRQDNNTYDIRRKKYIAASFLCHVVSKIYLLITTPFLGTRTFNSDISYALQEELAELLFGEELHYHIEEEFFEPSTAHIFVDELQQYYPDFFTESKKMIEISDTKKYPYDDCIEVFYEVFQNEINNTETLKNIAIQQKQQRNKDRVEFFMQAFREFQKMSENMNLPDIMDCLACGIPLEDIMA